MSFLNFPDREITENVRISRYAGGAAETQGHAVLLRAAGGYNGDVSNIEIAVTEHRILSYTASGCWIDRWEGKKFVNLRCEKQWASTTEAEAIDQLWHRKLAQVRILSQQLQVAEAVKAGMATAFGKKPPAPRVGYYRDESGY